MPASGTPFVEEAMNPIKKSIPLSPFLRENNNNGTQENNKITTTTKKDREQQSEHAVPAGKLELWAKVILKFTNLTILATQRFHLIVKASLIFGFFSCFISLFYSADMYFS